MERRPSSKRGIELQTVRDRRETEQRRRSGWSNGHSTKCVEAEDERGLVECTCEGRQEKRESLPRAWQLA